MAAENGRLVKIPCRSSVEVHLGAVLQKNK